MKGLISIIVIFAVAAGLVVAARYNTGYALLVWPPYRVEVSLNLLIVLTAAAFAAFYVVLRAISGTVRLPARVQAYRLARRRQKAHAALLQSLRDFFAGRHARAERAASQLIERGEQPALCAIVAARAAHELRAYERRDAYLAQAAQLATEDDAARIVTEAELLVDQHRYQEALDALKALPSRHTAALRLELKAQQASRNWDRVLALVDPLEKRKVFDAEQAEQIRVRAHAENLKRKGFDGRALAEAWQNIPARHKKDSRIAAAAARCFIALGECAKAHEIIEQSLNEYWDQDLAALYGECENGDTLRRIERAERWLQSQPQDAVLLFALGRLCARQGLWGKAQSYLEASVAIEPTYSAQLALAELQDKLGNNEAAHRHSQESLRLAVARLRQLTGGRRKTLF